MAFKINIDRFGFAEKPNPDKTCRDYTIGYLNKFINNEAEERISADNTLQSNLNTEAETRINEDNSILSKLQEETDEIRTHINSVSENVYTKSEVDGITGYIESDIGNIENSIGNIETALDSIIAIQNRLMGVSE